MICHKGYIQMTFFPKIPRNPKIFKSGFPPLCTPIISYANLQLRLGFEKSCSPHRKLSNDMWHTPYTHINQGNSWLLVLGNQIDSGVWDVILQLHSQLTPFHALTFITSPRLRSWQSFYFLCINIMPHHFLTVHFTHS
jgi:hypothetical protein